MLSSVLPILLAFLPTIAFARPTLQYEIADQRPPLAHVSSAFNFSLFPDTFTSSLPLDYTVSDLPTWVSFNPESLTFAGTAASTDEGRSTVQVTASDSEGNRTSVFSLIVVTSAPPFVNTPIATQLSNNRSISSAVRLPSSRGVLIHPYYSFSLGFTRSTFVSPNGLSIFYSALTSTSTALPSWLSFDNNTATFNGVAPASGSWDVILAGGEIEGFGDVRDVLTIEIGLHALDLLEELETVEAVTGTEIVHQLEISQLRLDGNTIERKDLYADVSLDGYSDWLTFDSSNQTLIGTPPSTWQNGSLAPIILPVRFTSTTTNATLTTSLPLSIHPYPFTSLLLPNSTATGNSSFSYDVTPYLVNQTVTLSVAYSPPEVGDWLSFDASTGVLSGEVPQVVDYRSAEVAVTATDPTSNLPGTSHLGILIVGAMVIPSTRTSSAASSPTSKYDAGAARLSKTSQIVIGTVIAGVFVLAVLVLLLACCCIRRHRRARAAAIAAANEKNEKPSGADGEGLTDVSLADPDPFRNYSTGSFGNPHDTATGGAFAALPQESPSKKKDKPRRLDMMRGLFGRGQSTTTLDPDGSGNSRPSSPANQLPKDLSGLPRSLVRSDSNDSFFSGDDHGQTLTPDGEPRVVGEDGSQRGAGITRDPLSAAGGLAAPLAAGVTALPFVGIRMLGSREPSLLGMAHSLNSSSPTFSTVEDGDAGSARRVGSGEGEGDVTSDEGSRASWESDSSFQWNSGDVRGSASNGDSLAGSGGMGSGSVRAAAGAAAVGAGMRLIRESSSRSLDGDSRRHHRQPSSASRLSSSGSDPNLARPRFFPPSSLSNTFTARSSDFADASEDASSSSPHPHPHQRGAPLPNSHSQPLTTSEDHSNESSDGFGSSSLEEGTSFGADSVMSPLARIGGDGAGLSSRDLGASTDGERGGTVDSMTPDSLLDDSLLDASAEPSSAPTPLPLIAALNHPRSRQKPQNLAPNDADPSPVSRNSSNASRASRPRPRLHPSSERVPVISHFPPPQSYHHLQPQPPQPLSARPQNPLPQSSRLSHSSPRSLQHASTSSPNSQSTYSPNPNLLSPNPNSNQASNNNPHFPMTSQYSDSFADADSDVDYHSSYPYPDPSSPSSAYSPNPNNDRRRSSFNRRSVQYAPSPANDLQNLGYPASSAIYFSEPPTDPQSPPHSSLPTSGSDPARGANPEETIRPVSYQSNAGGGGEGGAPTGWGGGGGGLPTLGRPMEDESDPFERR